MVKQYMRCSVRAFILGVSVVERGKMAEEMNSDDGCRSRFFD